MPGGNIKGPMIKAIIFDRDGVLLDSESTNVEAAIETFARLGIEIRLSDKDRIVGRHPDDYLRYFHAKYKFDHFEYLSGQASAYEKNLKTAPLFAETINLVHLLKKNFRLALTTSSDKDTTAQVLERCGLKTEFDIIVTREEATRKKPDPEPYLLTAKKLKLSPAECLVVEDTNIGLTAAKRAGMKCIIIPNTYTRHQDFSAADLLVESARDITEEKIQQF